MTDKRPTHELPDEADRGDERVGEALELVVALEPTSDERDEERDAHASEGDAVEAFARFIAELGPAPEEVVFEPDEAEADDDEPTLARSTRQLVDETAPRRSIPPALPPAATIPPPSADPANVLLGPPLSMRGDPTERIITLPKTHPLANSIAPGGSAVSVPPGAARAPRRWPLALGGAALLAIGVGTSVLLQSRGEQHAAAHAPSTTSVEGWPTSDVRRAPVAQAAMLADEPAPASTVSAPDAGVLAPGEVAAPSTELATASPASSSPALAAAAAAPAGATSKVLRYPERPRPLHVALGAVALRRAAAPKPGPASGTVARARVMNALGGLHDEVRACVGDAHGVADVVLTVRGSGIVSHALVEGAFAGSPAGSCIARALRNAKLPPFAEPSVRITYPFRL